MRFNLNKGAPLGTFFYNKKDVIYGPFQISDLLSNIDQDMLVYREGKAWMKAKDYPELSQFFNLPIENEIPLPVEVPIKKIPVRSSSENSASVVNQAVSPNKKNNFKLAAAIIIFICIAVFLIIKNRSTPELSTLNSGSTLSPIDSLQSGNSQDDEVYKTLSSTIIDEAQLQRTAFSDIISYGNELLARHGFIFENKDVLDYYNRKPWYKPENNFLMSTAGFSPIEKSNYDILDKRNVEVKNKINDIIHNYYNSLAEDTFDANNFYSERVDRYITRKNLSSSEINALFKKEKLDFTNPRFQFIEPIVIEYEGVKNGADFFSFKVFYGVFRPSKNKYQTCSIKLRWGFNQNFKITHYEEAGLENLKFSEKDDFDAEITNNISNITPGKYPEGSTRILTDNEVSNQSKDDLKLMRNEIYARHGYIFNTSEMVNYFSKQSWYSPTSSDVNSSLTEIEKKNIQLIKSYE